MSLREELERVVSMGQRPIGDGNGNVNEYKTAIANLIRDHGQALLDALEDAVRYRWLKDKGIVRAHPMKALFKGETRIFADASRWIAGDFTYLVKGEMSELDQAIDAAIKGDG